MNKFQIVKQMRNNGDSLITMQGDKEDIGATLEFNEKYIKRKRSQRLKIQKDCILMFSWTDDKFRNVSMKDIKSITPLSAVLRNPSPEIIIDG